MFRVGLVMLKYGLRSQVLKRCPGMYETLQALRNIEHGVMAEGFLLFQVRVCVCVTDLEYIYVVIP